MIIIGNEVADKAAALGHKNDRSEKYDITVDEQINIFRRKFMETWNDRWIMNAKITGKGLFLKNIKNDVRQIELMKFRNRRHETVLHRLRTGHAGLKSYLYRIGLSDTDKCDYCNTAETIEHC